MPKKKIKKIKIVSTKALLEKAFNKKKKAEVQYTESDMKVLEILPFEIETAKGCL